MSLCQLTGNCLFIARLQIAGNSIVCTKFVSVSMFKVGIRAKNDSENVFRLLAGNEDTLQEEAAEEGRHVREDSAEEGRANKRHHFTLTESLQRNSSAEETGPLQRGQISRSAGWSRGGPPVLGVRALGEGRSPAGSNRQASGGGGRLELLSWCDTGNWISWVTVICSSTVLCYCAAFDFSCSTQFLVCVILWRHIFLIR